MLYIPSQPTPKMQKTGDKILAVFYFSRSSDILSGESLDIANKLRFTMDAVEDKFVFFSGYASLDGDPQQNMDLSQRRIKETMSILGIDIGNANVFTKAYGASASAETETATDRRLLKYQRQLNRKVSVFIMPLISMSLIKPNVRKPTPPTMPQLFPTLQPSKKPSQNNLFSQEEWWKTPPVSSKPTTMESFKNSPFCAKIHCDTVIDVGEKVKDIAGPSIELMFKLNVLKQTIPEIMATDEERN